MADTSTRILSGEYHFNNYTDFHSYNHFGGNEYTNESGSGLMKTNKYELLAIKRHKMIWKRYEENGQKITWAECEKVMGIFSGSLPRLKDCFRGYGLQVPPIWNDPPVKYLRISKIICEKFPRGDATQAEMANVLGVGIFAIYYNLKCIKKFGYDLPGKLAYPKFKPNLARSTIPEKGTLHAIKSSKRELSDGSIAYRLR